MVRTSNLVSKIENGNTANQIHGFTIDYGKFTLKLDRNTVHVFLLNERVYTKPRFDIAAQGINQ